MNIVALRLMIAMVMKNVSMGSRPGPVMLPLWGPPSEWELSTLFIRKVRFRF